MREVFFRKGNCDKGIIQRSSLKKRAHIKIPTARGLVWEMEEGRKCVFFFFLKKKKKKKKKRCPNSSTDA